VGPRLLQAARHSDVGCKSDKYIKIYATSFAWAEMHCSLRKYLIDASTSDRPRGEYGVTVAMTPNV